MPDDIRNTGRGNELYTYYKESKFLKKRGKPVHFLSLFSSSLIRLIKETESEQTRSKDRIANHTY